MTIELLFRCYKARKSPNAMSGVSKQIFFLPVPTKIDNDALRVVWRVFF
jgi:hypothetical protein